MLPGVRLSALEYNQDRRGWLAEIYRIDRDAGVEARQVNVMHSVAESMRGCHIHRSHHDIFHIPSGRALVGLRDVRRASPSFGASELMKIPGAGGTLTVPPGVAHVVYFPVDSFLVTIESLLFDPEEELKVDWRMVGVEWPFPIRAPAFPGADGLSYEEVLERVEPWQREWKTPLEPWARR